MNRLADKTFGINVQARLVLEYLTNQPVDFEDNPFSALFSTSPWYNGRERGVCISMSVDQQNSIHIAVFEHRNSDELCCLKWETKHPYWNHPLEDPKVFEVAYGGKDKWHVSAQFKYMEILPCCNWIAQTFEDFYAAERARQAKPTTSKQEVK